MEIERAHEEVHQESAQAVDDQQRMGKHHRQRHGGFARRTLILQEAHQRNVGQQAENPSDPEQRRGPQPAGDQRPNHDSDDERQANRNSQHRHGGRALLGFDVIGDGGERDGNDRSPALHEAAENQFPNLPGVRKYRRQRAEERADAEQRHAERQNAAAPDAIGKPAQRNLKNRHHQRIRAESETDEKFRFGELQAVKGEDRQDKKQA